MGCLCSKGTQFDDIKIPKIDPNRCGPDIRLGTNNRVAGRGTALCNTNVLQDRMYFECKIINPNGEPRVPPLRPMSTGLCGSRTTPDSVAPLLQAHSASV
jgi:hypothetical protein